MARQLDTRIVTSALIAVAAASVPAALVLSVCYGALRLWLDALFVSLSHKANVVIAATFLHLLILGTFLWLYTRRSRLAPDDRQLVIDSYTPSIRAVLFCTFMMAVAATLFAGKSGFQVANELIGRHFFRSTEMIIVPVGLMMSFYWGAMILLLPKILHRRLVGEGQPPARPS